MSQRLTPDLPGTGGRFSATGDGQRCEEVLVRQPSGSGAHLWVQVERTDLSTSQARQAVARSVAVEAEAVSAAGNRDRRGCCLQWFSLPAVRVEHPQALRNAGFQSKLRVRQTALSGKPVGEAAVSHLRWTARIRAASGDDGYRKAKAILDACRRRGVPNYIHPGLLGRDGEWARWGRMLLEGKRLPVTAGKVAGPGRCLWAVQASLFNRYLATRLADGLLCEPISGERFRSGTGNEETVDNAQATAPRYEAWEAQALGPLYGKDLSPVSGLAAEREAVVLSEAGLDAEAVGRLHGGRRMVRFRPAQSLIDIDGKDLLVRCDLPVDAHLAVLLEEIIKPEGHL